MIRCALIVFAASTLLGATVASGVPDNVYEIGIKGMTCKGCVKEVTDLLTKVENVKSVEVDLKGEKATVTMKGAAVLDRAAVEKSLKGSKFSVSSFAEKKIPESKPTN